MSTSRFPGSIARFAHSAGLASWLSGAVLVIASSAQAQGSAQAPTGAPAPASPPAAEAAAPAAVQPAAEPAPAVVQPTAEPAPTPPPTVTPAPAAEPVPVAPAPLATTPVPAPQPTVATPAQPAAVTQHWETEAQPHELATSSLAEDVPVRELRRIAISGELGWNTLPGLGALFTFHPISAIALETGLGLSPAGLKTGLRARWNILPSSWTPTIGAGLLYATGTGDSDAESELNGKDISFKVLGSPFAQLVAGVNFTGEGHFFFSALAGYAVLLREKNVVLTEGDPDPDDFDVLKSILGGGIVLSITVGGAL